MSRLFDDFAFFIVRSAMADANSLGFTLRPQRLRKARCFVNVGNRIIRMSLTPIALLSFALIYAKYKHIRFPIEIAPVAIDLMYVLILLPLILLLFAVFLLDQAFNLKFILCPRCSKPVFDAKLAKESYPQQCFRCGFDIGPCKS
jgi:hypothetical protein